MEQSELIKWFEHMINVNNSNGALKLAAQKALDEIYRLNKIIEELRHENANKI